MKKFTIVSVLLLALAAIGLFAADKISVFTRSTTLTETKHVTTVQASYDTAGNLTQLVVNYNSDRVDGGGFIGTTAGSDVWTLDKVNALQDVVAGETNRFKTQMLARWNNFDTIAENYVTGWKNPAWMVP